MGARTEHVRGDGTEHDAAASQGIVGDAFIGVEAGSGGAAWRLQPAARGLDANVIVLPAGDEVKRHIGPALDVLLMVLDGSGMLELDGEELTLSKGALLWLPPHAERRVVAGDEGLRYFSVHQRKPGLGIGARPE